VDPDQIQIERSDPYPDPHKNDEQDPDPHLYDPDPHLYDADLRHCFLSISFS
jgi:hypothetical protein